MNAVTHICDGDANPVEDLVWTMLCGAKCFAYEDASLDPPGFDFYLLGHGHEKATCATCRDEAQIFNEPIVARVLEPA